MNQSRLEWRVGIFALVGLVLVAALLIKFSKAEPFFKHTYELRLQTRNVGGIKRGAVVLMAGVPIGTVGSTELSPDGRLVTIHLRVLRQYGVPTNAVFSIEQAGFLGDQYVAVAPGRTAAPPLADGALAACQEPFNVQEAARSAATFLQRIDATAQNLNEAVVRLDRTLLAESNLTNVTTTVSNFRLLSERSLGTIAQVEGVLATNAPSVSVGVSNLVDFSRRLNLVAGELEQTVTNNRGQFTAVVKNIDSATVLVNDLLTDLQAGKGLAGSLLKDEQMQNQISVIVSNLATVSSNLARFGLLYKPRPVKAKETSPQPAYPGRRTGP